MGRLIKELVGLLAYACVATVLAEGATVAYLRHSGNLSDEKVSQVVAVLQGADLASAKTETEAAPKDPDHEQPSYEDRQLMRDLRARNLELREQTLNSRLELVRAEQSTLMTDKDRLERLKAAFKEQLGTMRDETLASGMQNVCLIWENIKPKLVKELIMQMLDNGEIVEVVSILSAISDDSRSRIIGEFKGQEDLVKLDEILRLIREGVPQSNLINKTITQLQP